MSWEDVERKLEKKYNRSYILTDDSWEVNFLTTTIIEKAGVEKEQAEDAVKKAIDQHSNSNKLYSSYVKDCLTS